MLHERIEINQWLVAILLVRLLSGSLVALGRKITDSQWNESRNPHVFVDVIISTSEVIIQPLDVKFYQVVAETGVGQPCFILPDAPKACSFCWSKQKPLCWWFNYRELGVALNPCETFRQTGHLPRFFWIRKSSLHFFRMKNGFKKKWRNPRQTDRPLQPTLILRCPTATVPDSGFTATLYTLPSFLAVRLELETLTRGSGWRDYISRRKLETSWL